MKSKHIKRLKSLEGVTDFLKSIEDNKEKDPSIILERAVIGWLDILRLPEAKNAAKELLSEFTISANPKLPIFKRGKKAVNSYERTPNYMFILKILKPVQLAFVALGFAVASYVVYQIYTRTKQNEASEETPTVVPQNVEHIVIFAIEAKEEKMLQWFKDKNFDAIQASGELYGLSKYLWYGEPRNLQDTRISSFLNNDVETQTDDVYDVHLVKCTLRRDVPGFIGAASAMDRMDAFEQFFPEITDCEVSERVSYEVYNTELYKTR